MESKKSTYVEELTKTMEAMKSMVKTEIKLTDLNGFSVPLPFKEQFKSYKSFRVRPDDIFVCTFPKSVMLSPWVEHVKQYWNRREADNVLFLTYEEMSRDLQSCVKRVASFLGKVLSEDEVQAICHHTSFTSMRDNNTTNFSWMEHIDRQGEGKFMRKGKVGDWKTHLTPEMSTKIEKLVDENLEPLGLKMVYELDEEPQKTETA